MKKSFVKVSTLLSRICAGALIFLGVGCSSDDDDPSMGVMYGTLNSEFEIKGSVSDPEGNPVPDAKIVVGYPLVPSTQYNCGVGVTSKTGSYNVKGKDYSSEFKVVCLPNNPNLEADSTNVKAEFKHVSGTNLKAEINVDFTLKEKKTEE